jgi:hypothetical protein
MSSAVPLRRSSRLAAKSVPVTAAAPVSSIRTQHSENMTSALQIRRSSRVAAKAHAKLVAARLAYETACEDSKSAEYDFRVAFADRMAKRIDSDVFFAIRNRNNALWNIVEAAGAAYNNEKAAYKKAVGDDNLHM